MLRPSDDYFTKKERGSSLFTKPGGTELLLGYRVPDDRAFGFRAPDGKRRQHKIVTHAADCHAITVAPTGCGKTRGLTIPNALHYDGPLILHDPKGEVADVTVRRRLAMGHPVIVIDPYGVTLYPTDAFNPIEVLRLPNTTVDEDAMTLAEMLSVGHIYRSDAFWNDHATDLIAGVICFLGWLAEARAQDNAHARQEAVEEQQRSERAAAELESAKKNAPQSVRDADEMLALLRDRKRVRQRSKPAPKSAKPTTSALDHPSTMVGATEILFSDDTPFRIAKLLDAYANDMPPMARRLLSSFLGHSAEKTREGVLSTARTYFRSMNGQLAQKALADSTFALSDLLDGRPLTVYLAMPSSKLRSHASLVRLWVGTLLMTMCYRNGQRGKPTLFLMDEFAQLEDMPLVREAVTLMRGQGAFLWMIFQDLDQLKHTYGRSWRTIVGNCGVVQTFRQRFGQDARDWADILGCSEADLRELPPGYSLASVDGDLHKLKNLDYLKDPRFRGLADPNPRYPGSKRHPMDGRHGKGRSPGF